MRKISEILCLRRYQLAIIVLAVLIVYYSALGAGFCLVDDLAMMQRVNGSQFSWMKTFMPGGRFYYRPLLELSFRFDEWMWGFMPSFMHLENILLHLVNTCLVYFIAGRFFRLNQHNQAWGPLLAALLFGLHPLATESVNWISGRTDPLASLFVLLSVLALFQALDTGCYRWVLLASLACGVGALCKEVMVFFFPAAITLIWLYPGSSEEKVSEINRQRVLAVFCSPLILLLFAFLVMRVGMRGAAAMGVSDLMDRNRYAPWDMARVYFKVTGFYIKKLFWPIPLNFAIIKISNLYIWLGLAVFGGLIYRARKNPWLWVPWIMAGLLLVPAFFIAIADVTWAPVAERYAYLSAAFWSVGLVGIVFSLKSFQTRPVSWTMLLLVLLGSFTLLTVQRNLIWQDNVLLFADTVAKSPEHVGVRNELGNALLERGMIAEATHQYQVGLLQTNGAHRQLSYNLARAYLVMKRPLLARQLLLRFVNEKEIRQAPLPFLKKLALADACLLENSQSSFERQKYGQELLDVYEAVYSKTGQTVVLFRGGQLAQKLGLQKRASNLFSRAYTSAPEDAFFRKLAGQLAEELSDDTIIPVD